MVNPGGALEVVARGRVLTRSVGLTNHAEEFPVSRRGGEGLITILQMW
jgi:hypothetical protein